ncbi:MAG: glycosyltransferase family 4 protein [bacterium]|nr:glycosyltransferase family 4 protein [bacterium]
MKIVFLSFYSGEVSRGVETYVHELSNQLVKLGHQVIVYQNGPARKDSQYQTKSANFVVNWHTPTDRWAIPPFQLVSYWSRLIWSFTQWALAKIVPEEADILIATNGRLQSVLARLWTWNHRKKLIIAGQSGPGIDDRWNLWCWPDTFVALTQYQAQWARKANRWVKVVSIPNGVDPHMFGKTTARLKLKIAPPVVLAVAALERNKRLDLAIKAVSRLPQASLLIVGQGEEKESLEILAQQSLPDRYQMLSVSYDQMPQVYAQANVFVYPTIPNESFGIALLEAMASGLPVVANNDPIRKEIIGPAGILVDPVDTELFAQAIKQALEKKWGNAPVQQATKFSWINIAKSYSRLFSELTK